MILLDQSRVQGFWRSRETYEMVDKVTGKIRLTQVIGAGYSDLVTKEELDDIILEYEEKFIEELRYAQPRKHFSKTEQHDLGKTANEIKDSQRHRKESLHGRYWDTVGGIVPQRSY